MLYKCKICGGSLEIKDNETIAVCEYCGTKQTLPKLVIFLIRSIAVMVRQK